MMDSAFDFHKPKTAMQWLIFLGATGIILSSPAGTKAFIKELHKYFNEEGGNKKKYENAQLSQALYYLKKRKIIEIKKMDNGETRIKLTEAGRKKKIHRKSNHREGLFGSRKENPEVGAIGGR